LGLFYCLILSDVLYTLKHMQSLDPILKMPQPTTCFKAWISFNTFPLLMEVEAYVNRTAVPYTWLYNTCYKLHLLNHEQCTQSSQFSRLWQFFYMKKPIELWQNLSNPSLSFLGQDTEYIPLYICHHSELTPLE
jgi:hypothetical protein